MQKLRSFIVSSIVIAIPLLLVVAVFEVALRVTMKDQINLFPRYHDSVEYGDYTIRRFLPNASFRHTSVDGQWDYQMNSQGFRDERDYEIEKPEDKKRVLVLGDSHTAGFEVHQWESYAAKLQEALGTNWEVLNTGISGFGTAEQLVYLENQGLKYQPDVVVVGFYANDFGDNVKSALYKLDSGKLIASSNEHAPGMSIQRVINNFPPLQWLGQYSYAYSFVFNSLYVLAKDLLQQSRQEEVKHAYAVSSGDATSYETELAALLLARMEKSTVDAGAKLVIVDIPQTASEGRVHPSLSPEVLENLTQTSILDVAQVTATYSGAHEDLHLANGHRHISPAYHQLIATQLAAKLADTGGQ